MTNKNDNNTTDSQVEIDGVIFNYRCDICWQELDDTDIQFKPCNRCHLQVCLFCFNKHTTRKESYAKTCPKCREPIDMEKIMKQNTNNIKHNKNSIGKKLLTNKQKIIQNTNTNKRKRNNNNNNNNKILNIDIDEEVPKTDWKNYLKGRFISRDSIIVAPVVAKFNNEEAIEDNFKAYGRITRINMWDDESAHIMYDKQYFADALVDKIQDVAVRYQGQFGLMSAKYHFRRPCEEFMDPERRCPMQCRKFHGPYYKLDFIPLDEYLDEDAREHWILQRKKLVSGIIKTRYKKFRKKFMDGSPLPVSDKSKNRSGRGGYDEYYDEYNEYYDDDEYYHDGYYEYNNRSRRPYNNKNSNVNKNAITLKYNAMGKANKLLALDDSLQKHMRSKPNQPLPPSRPPPHPPHDNDSIKDSIDNNSNSGSVSSGKRTRPPIHHTTSAQMSIFNNYNDNKSNKVKKVINNIQKINRTKSSEENNKGMKLNKIMQLRTTKSDINGYDSHNSGDYNKIYSSSSSNLKGDEIKKRNIYSNSSSNLQKKKSKTKTKTVDLLKSLKKKKRKQRTKIQSQPVQPPQPTRQPIPHNIIPKATFTPHPQPHNNNNIININPSSILQPQFGHVSYGNTVPSFKPNPDAIPFNMSPKKSKLNAYAASYKPLSASSSDSGGFKVHNNNIKSFDIRNLGPLDGDILNREHHKNIDYDFSSALNESHADLNNDYSNQKKGVPDEIIISSDESSDDEYDIKEKWNEESVWERVLDIMEKGQGNDNAMNNWLNVRKGLKNEMSVNDWIYIKGNGLVKKIKGTFRKEFGRNNGKDRIKDLKEKNRVKNTSLLMKKLCLKTPEASAFGNLEYNKCMVIDLDLRISDIRDYMTDLLTQNRDEILSEYDTNIIAELGQILNVYHAWINERNINKEINESDGIKQLFGNRNNNLFVENAKHNTSSDFYTKLLDEVQQKAECAHGDHEYFDNDEHNPKDLVMDYIGFGLKGKEKEREEVLDDVKEEYDDELYKYEYSDDTDEENNNIEEKENVNVDENIISKQEEVVVNNATIDSAVNNNINNTEMYGYDNEYEYERNDSGNNGIFSRVHSPPPRHRNNSSDMNGNVNDDCIGQNSGSSNGNGTGSDRHYYNARYPPRRGRYGRGIDGNSGHYRQRNQNVMRYNSNQNNKTNLNQLPAKMEWKKKEKENGNDMDGNSNEIIEKWDVNVNENENKEEQEMDDGNSINNINNNENESNQNESEPINTENDNNNNLNENRQETIENEEI